MEIDRKPTNIFNKDRAGNYDKSFAKLFVMKGALHLLTRIVFSDLPNDAHILIVGAGTGPELFDLADHNPGWRFTAVDPAEEMLDICRKKAEEKGIISRCIFHKGYLSSLAQEGRFDAATCFLVSHFLTDIDERQALFAEIGSRLVPNGILVNADISGDKADPHFENLLSVWLRMFCYADLPAANVEKMRASLDTVVAVLPPKKIEQIIKKSGFCEPTLMYQSLLIHAWYSRFGVKG